MNLPQLPPDKANHALYGALIFNVAFMASRSLAIAATCFGGILVALPLVILRA